jgi:hypothetical protein
VVVDGQDKLQDGSKVSPTAASATPPNGQSANGSQQPSSQQGNPPNGAGARQRMQAPQQDHSAGNSR